MENCIIQILYNSPLGSLLRYFVIHIFLKSLFHHIIGNTKNIISNKNRNFNAICLQNVIFITTIKLRFSNINKSHRTSTIIDLTSIIVYVKCECNKTTSF